MSKINKKTIHYKDLKELPDRIIYELKRKTAYNETYDKNMSFPPVLSIEYIAKVKNITQKPEVEQEIFVKDEEIAKGEKRLEEFDKDENIKEIEAIYYIYKK